jgi:hypothetical protein
MLSYAPHPLQGQTVHDLTWFFLVAAIIFASVFLIGPVTNVAHHLYASVRRRLSRFIELPRLKR